MIDTNGAMYHVKSDDGGRERTRVGFCENQTRMRRDKKGKKNEKGEERREEERRMRREKKGEKKGNEVSRKRTRKRRF